MDTVFLHGLKAQTLIGVFDWERRQPQTVLLDIDIRADLSAAEKSDNVADMWRSCCSNISLPARACGLRR